MQLTKQAQDEFFVSISGAISGGTPRRLGGGISTRGNWKILGRSLRRHHNGISWRISERLLGRIFGVIAGKTS